MVRLTPSTPLNFRNIDKFLIHEDAETGDFTPGGTPLNSSDWIDWSEPTLEHDTELYDEN